MSCVLFQCLTLFSPLFKPFEQALYCGILKNKNVSQNKNCNFQLKDYNCFSFIPFSLLLSDGSSTFGGTKSNQNASSIVFETMITLLIWTAFKSSQATEKLYWKYVDRNLTLNIYFLSKSMPAIRNTLLILPSMLIVDIVTCNYIVEIQYWIMMIVPWFIGHSFQIHLFFIFVYQQNNNLIQIQSRHWSN